MNKVIQANNEGVFGNSESLAWIFSKCLWTNNILFMDTM